MGYTAEQTVEAVITLPQKVWGVAEAIVGVHDRDPNSPVSIVGGSRIAGETVSVSWLPTDAKVTFLLMLIAGFNFFIGAFNFIPLLPLDGGHIASALWEEMRRIVARLRGRPDPGFVDAAKLLPVAYVMATAMLAMSLVLIVGDLVVPIHITG
jgi:membrane-associated protease RseP (regulator of RpoE activity)